MTGGKRCLFAYHLNLRDRTMLITIGLAFGSLGVVAVMLECELASAALFGLSIILLTQGS